MKKVAAILALGVGLAAQPAKLVAQARESAVAAGQIEGTWLMTVTPPPGGPPPYAVVVSFARGGVFLSSPDFGSTATGQGTWAHERDQVYRSVHVVVNATAPIPAPTMRITSTFQLTGKDTFAGFGYPEVCPGGFLVGCFLLSSQPATIEGTRLTAF